MSTSLTPQQTLLLWSLIGQGGAAWRSELKPELSAKDRRALEKARLVTSEKRGRSLWIEVTENGWGWANGHLGSPLPGRSQSAGPILQAWLTRLEAFLHQHEFTLADLIAPCINKTKPLPPTALEERIRRAYLDVTGGAWNKRVRLSELRNRLSDVAREAIDAALLKMQQASRLLREKVVRLAPLGRRKHLSNRLAHY
jgi:hypothetical protein